jgi:hypothetical protein
MKNSQPPNDDDILIRDLENRERSDALKHRYREAQQMIQQQEY